MMRNKGSSSYLYLWICWAYSVNLYPPGTVDYDVYTYDLSINNYTFENRYDIIMNRWLDPEWEWSHDFSKTNMSFANEEETQFSIHVGTVSEELFFTPVSSGVVSFVI